MGKENEEALNKYVEAFQKHLSEVDQLAQIVLKGHLIIESALENIIQAFFFHPAHILERRLPFHHKVAICRSLCLRKDQERTWELIEAINAVRNEIAHKLDGKILGPKVARVKELYLAEGYPAKVDGKDLSDDLIVLNGCSACVGFLGRFEEDVKALRGHINLLDAVLNGAAKPTT